jgi:phosphoenolpyruvate-protein phosphotransferase (PTS system enzyme I)
MEILQGIPVSHGVAIGPALVLDTEGVRIPHRQVPPQQVEAEVVRLHQALAAAAAETRADERSITERLGKSYGAIFAAHALFFEDPNLQQELDALVRRERFSAEYAVSWVVRSLVKQFENLGPKHFLATRTADLYDLEKRILTHLLGERREPLAKLTEPVIVLAYDLSPSETAMLDPNRVYAFATEHGGRASHTAIMANALSIPAVVGLGKFLSDAVGGDLVIVDGTRGLLILEPDEETIERYQKLRDEQRLRDARWVTQRGLPAQTRDGVRVSLLGNIEFPNEAKQCVERGAEGVGLYRTEFLYLGRDVEPSEEEHFEAYMTVLRQIGPKRPVVIRTLDLGADKFGALAGASQEEKNPSLGLRSVRLCLRNLPLFRKQMRAILRASAHGDVWVMFPMVGTLLELRQCKMLLAEVKEDLEDAGIAFNRDVPIGTMIEVPSAALMADNMAREVDFFSIGTNDLVQYTLAADRTNENVAGLYNPADPAVLRLIRMVVEAGRRHGVEVNVCGEMSGDPVFTQLLIGLGLRQLSVTPHLIPDIKKVIRLIEVHEAERVAAAALALETARDVTHYLQTQLRRILPEAVD